MPLVSALGRSAAAALVAVGARLQGCWVSSRLFGCVWWLHLTDEEWPCGSFWIQFPQDVTGNCHVLSDKPSKATPSSGQGVRTLTHIWCAAHRLLPSQLDAESMRSSQKVAVVAATVHVAMDSTRATTTHGVVRDFMRVVFGP